MGARTLSSFPYTFFLKVLLPLGLAWGGCWVLFFVWTASVTNGQPPPTLSMKLLNSLLSVGGPFIIFKEMAKVKFVSMDGQNLFIKDLTKQITVPFSDIANVERARAYTSGAAIKVRFLRPLSCGETIYFYPAVSGLHKVNALVSELRSLARE